MLIKVKVYPCSKPEIIQKTKDFFEIKVKEKPEQGKANQAIKKVLAKFFRVDQTAIKIIKGHYQKNKIIKIN
jgi:hypothetical protein